MSTIKFVPMEFFAQFGLTQMRRLQARGAVGAAFPGAGRGWWAQVVVCTAFPARGAYCERWALSARLSGSGAGLAIVGSPFVRLSRRRVPIVNAGRCRCGFPGTGTSLADVGRCLRAWGAVGGRGVLSARLFRAREHHWRMWRAVGRRRSLFADAEAPLARLFRMRGGVGGRRSLFVRLSRRRVPIVNAGRYRRGFPGAGTSLADVESCWWTWGAVGGRRSLLAA